jgi:hypothetical protein
MHVCIYVRIILLFKHATRSIFYCSLLLNIVSMCNTERTVVSVKNRYSIVMTLLKVRRNVKYKQREEKRR